MGFGITCQHALPPLACERRHVLALHHHKGEGMGKEEGKSGHCRAVGAVVEEGNRHEERREVTLALELPLLPSYINGEGGVRWQPSGAACPLAPFDPIGSRAVCRREVRQGGRKMESRGLGDDLGGGCAGAGLAATAARSLPSLDSAAEEAAHATMVGARHAPCRGG